MTSHGLSYDCLPLAELFLGQEDSSLPPADAVKVGSPPVGDADTSLPVGSVLCIK